MTQKLICKKNITQVARYLLTFTFLGAATPVQALLVLLAKEILDSFNPDVGESL